MPSSSGTLSRPPLERMLRIHERLQAAGGGRDDDPGAAARRGGEPVNCTRLARELEVSTKTIQRDVDFMRDRLGLPIAYDPARGGYFYAQPVSHFPTVQVSEGELVALFVARQAMNQYRGTPFERPLRAAFEKLTGGLRDQIQFAWFGELDGSISFRSSAGQGVVSDLKTFEAVSQAVLHHEEIEFDYRKLGAAQPERRRLRPLHLACVDQQWYLFGQDLGRRGTPLRTFALTRMGAPRRTGTHFERPADGFSLEAHLADSFGVFAPAGPPTEVRLRFDPFAGRLISERVWHASQELRPVADGGVELRLHVSLSPEVERWVLSWGEHVEVLAPEMLREAIRRVARQVWDQLAAPRPPQPAPVPAAGK